jgi:hypothetical protein
MKQRKAELGSSYGTCEEHFWFGLQEQAGKNELP